MTHKETLKKKRKKERKRCCTIPTEENSETYPKQLFLKDQLDCEMKHPILKLSQCYTPHSLHQARERVQKNEGKTLGILHDTVHTRVHYD